MTETNNRSPFGRRPDTSSEYALPPSREEVEARRRELAAEHASNGGSQPDDTLARYREEQRRSQKPIVLQSPREALQPEDVIPPKRRSSRARSTVVRFFNFLMTMAFVAALLFVGSVWYGKTKFEAKGPLQEETTFTVPKGANFNSIIPGLEEKNIIPRQGPLRIFLRGVQSAGKGSALKAGEFAFQPGMSMREVMMQLTEGRAIQYSLSFPEGWTSHQIMQRVAAAEHLSGPVPEVPAEGSLLPNTYFIEKGQTRESFVQVLKDAQAKAVREVWENRAPDLPVKTPEELVILASIIEKETAIASERPRVASVFVNRLRKGMRLQTDPTVIYGIWGGEGKPKDRGGLRRSELDRDTPYNTYKIKGLPPGPIANPGLESLKAAANPGGTDDLYFVADGTGGHVFATTLDQHNANVKKWRVIEAERKKAAEEAEKNAEPAKPADAPAALEGAAKSEEKISN